MSRVQTRTVDVRTVTRRANPRGRRRPVHTAAFDRCVTDVRRKGGAVNPFAVCGESLKERGVLPAHRRRRGNPRRRPRQQYLIAARQGNRAGLAFAGDRFTSRSAEWVRFPSRMLAARFARHLKRSFRQLKGWRLAVVPV